MTVQPMTRVQMDRHSRKWIKLHLVTDPAVTDWEMTFDDGDTWHDATPVPGEANYYRWLVAGSRVTIGTAVTQLEPGEYVLVVRAVSDPELEAKRLVLEID